MLSAFHALSSLRLTAFSQDRWNGSLSIIKETEAQECETAGHQYTAVRGKAGLWLCTSAFAMMQSGSLQHWYLCWGLYCHYLWVSLHILNKFIGLPWRRQWHPTPVLLPGKPHGRRSLVGCGPWGREESAPSLEAWSFSYWTTREVSRL